ncbi:hypothetical protein [Niallia sp. MER TA 168]|uniref:hypothetical protein n=1 Tax=Niallia sp. MER TA 168 TaxID=2939568 RepID=UPI00203C053D|nr:hypothetical protein [Niallia sp. MER TA 168]
MEELIRSVANRLTNIPFSSIREIFDEANAMQKSGINITHMEIGRPDFDPPIHIKEAAKCRIARGICSLYSK